MYAVRQIFHLQNPHRERYARKHFSNFSSTTYKLEAPPRLSREVALSEKACCCGTSGTSTRRPSRPHRAAERMRRPWLWPPSALPFLLLLLLPARTCAQSASAVPCACAAADSCSLPDGEHAGRMPSVTELQTAAHMQCSAIPPPSHHPHPHEAILAPAVVVGVGALFRHLLLQSGLPIP